jgi:hypothetical protein
MLLSFVLFDSSLKLVAWKQLEQLGENGTYSIQGGSLL